MREEETKLHRNTQRRERSSLRYLATNLFKLLFSCSQKIQLMEIDCSHCYCVRSHSHTWWSSCVQPVNIIFLTRLERTNSQCFYNLLTLTGNGHKNMLLWAEGTWPGHSLWPWAWGEDPWIRLERQSVSIRCN